jgi:hypothetical protein
MSFHEEILAQRQRKALLLLAPVLAERGFYLGGTAIALYLGHRRPVDFDGFSETPIRDPLSLAREIQDQGAPFVTGWVQRGTLYGTVHGVRVSFFEYKYRLLKPLAHWPELGCQLASLPDLACMKLSAIVQRGSRKDFVDLYALGREGLRLQEMLDWYRTKFEVEDIGHVLYALVYFEDADAERMPTTVWKVDWRDVKRTIRDWVQTIGR